MTIKSQIGVRALVPINNGLVFVEHAHKNDRILVFPGGGLEDGETLFTAAIREVKEETHLEVIPERISYIREVIANGEYGIEFYIACRVKDGIPKLGVDPEHDDGNTILKGVRVIAIDELQKMTNWHPAELQTIIEHDFKSNFTATRYLGVSKIS